MFSVVLDRVTEIHELRMAAILNKAFTTCVSSLKQNPKILTLQKINNQLLWYLLSLLILFEPNRTLLLRVFIFVFDFAPHYTITNPLQQSIVKSPSEYWKKWFIGRKLIWGHLIKAFSLSCSDHSFFYFCEFSAGNYTMKYLLFWNCQ